MYQVLCNKNKTKQQKNKTKQDTFYTSPIYPNQNLVHIIPGYKQGDWCSERFSHLSRATQLVQ